MSIKNWNAGIMRPVAVAPTGPYENSAAPGMWTLDQVAYWAAQSLWPTAGNKSDLTVLTDGPWYTVQGGITRVDVAAFCQLSSTRGLIAFTTDTNGEANFRDIVVVVDISGTAITVYTPVIIRDGYSSYPERVSTLTPIDSTSAILSTGASGISLITISGTVPTKSSSVSFTGNAGRMVGVLTPTTYLVGMSVPGDTFSLRVNVVTRSGNTLSAGTTVTASTGDQSANESQVTTSASSATSGIIAHRNRLYPVTVSGTVPTVHSYITAEGSNYGSSGLGLSRISGNRHLVHASAAGGGSTTSVVVEQTGSALTTYASQTFNYTAGTVPATMDCMVFNNSGGNTAVFAIARTQSSNYIGLNILGTTVSAVTTNQISATAGLLVCGSLTSKTTVVPGWVGSQGPMRAKVITAS